MISERKKFWSYKGNTSEIWTKTKGGMIRITRDQEFWNVTFVVRVCLPSKETNKEEVKIIDEDLEEPEILKL